MKSHFLDDFKEKCIEIKSQHLSNLQRLLNKFTYDDPYSLSAGYYALTGRKGLWFYGDENRFLLLAQHPNIAEQIIAFPPFGENAAGLVKELLDDDFYRNQDLLLVRYTVDKIKELETVFPCAPQWITDECILDWKYPVHILDTGLTVKLEGSTYRKFRSDISRAIRSGVSSVLIHSLLDQNDLYSILRNWAETYTNKSYKLDDLLTPTIRVLDLFKNKILNINGLLFKHNGVAIGLIYWEENEMESGMANSFVISQISEIKGISRFIHYSMCKVLYERGFTYVCLGGSETKGLDQFKKSMKPSKSISLNSLKPEITL